MRAAGRGEDMGYLPPRGRYVSLLALVVHHGWGLGMIDRLCREGQLVRVGFKYLLR